MTSKQAKSEPTDFEKFDAAVRKILSVSHDELKRREKSMEAKTGTEKG